MSTLSDREPEQHPSNPQDQKRDLEQAFVDGFEHSADDHEWDEARDEENRKLVPARAKRPLPPSRDPDEQESDEGGEESDEDQGREILLAR